MGLMTDHLHEEIDGMAKIMAAVASGTLKPETLGRWVHKHHPDHAKTFEAPLKQPLTAEESAAIAALFT